jgi:di/tripeptidase
MESHSPREYVEVEELERLSRWLREIVQAARGLR